ncbi:MAG: shikimate kinase [bacterium]
MVSESDDARSLKPRRVFLLGFMGAGKTTTGKMLADEMGWPFHDLDDLIEEKEERSIADIFAEAGEEHFRDLETRWLAEISRRKPPLVVSCGGGVPLRRENREIMRERGIPVYLHITPETARKRIGTDADRPLFSGGEEGFEKVKKLWRERREDYEEIPHQIDSAAPREDVRKIKEIIDKYGQ